MAKATKSGKPLERFVFLVQETLKDKPDTRIHTNYKLPNTAGRQREIDVYIEAIVHNIAINIAIECKSYRKAVSVDKIEAFNSKCNRIPVITKKVFVSESGYQADAIEAAKYFNIDLLDVKHVSRELILQWLPVTQLGLRYGVNHYSLVLDASEQELTTIVDQQITTFYWGDGEEPTNIIEFLHQQIRADIKRLWFFNVLEFMKRGGTTGVSHGTSTPFELKAPNMYIRTAEGKQYALLAISGEVKSRLVESAAVITSSQTYGKNDQVEAARLGFTMRDPSNQLDAILTAERLKFFHTDQNGNTQELQRLATFDPDTSQLTFNSSEVNVGSESAS